MPMRPDELSDVLTGRAGPAGVRRVLCGPPMRAVLQRALLGCLPPGSSVHPRLYRSTFKPGRKLSAHYDVTISGPVPDRRRIAVSWTAGSSAASSRPRSSAAASSTAASSTAGRGTASSGIPAGPGMSAGAAAGAGLGAAAPESTAALDAAEDELRERGLAGPFSRLRRTDPASGLQLLVAPLDPVFPQLARLSDPAYLRQRLGGAHRVTTVRYRPGQRHVLRLDPDHGDGPRLFVKLYPEHAAAVHAIGSGMARLLGGQTSTPTLLAGDEAVVWPAAPGAALRWWLGRDPRSVAARLFEAGALLRAIHDTPPGGVGSELPIGRPIVDELAAIARTARHIGVLLPAVGARLAAVLADGADRLADLPAEPPTLIHGDFKVDHLLVGAGRLTVIDLDRCAWSDPAMDLAKFLADLRWWLLASGAAGFASLRADFLAGYGACPGERLARLRALEPVLLIKMAARRPRLHDPSWARLTTMLVAQAERLTADVIFPAEAAS